MRVSSLGLLLLRLVLLVRRLGILLRVELLPKTVLLLLFTVVPL